MIYNLIRLYDWPNERHGGFSVEDTVSTDDIFSRDTDFTVYVAM